MAELKISDWEGDFITNNGGYCQEYSLENNDAILRKVFRFERIELGNGSYDYDYSKYDRTELEYLDMDQGDNVVFDEYRLPNGEVITYIYRLDHEELVTYEV